MQDPTNIEPEKRPEGEGDEAQGPDETSALNEPADENRAPRPESADSETATGDTAVGDTAVGDTAVGDTAAGDTAADETDETAAGDDQAAANDTAPADTDAAETGTPDSDDAGEPEAVEIPELKHIIEASILAADKPLSIDAMISLFPDGEQPTRQQVRTVLEEIGHDFDDRGFELKQIASGYRFQVRQRYGEWVSRLWDERPPRYSRALLETLALIAYKQPITRGDVEEIRGVAVSTNIIRTLLEREWIRVVGHRDVPGRPAIYATTKNFLDYFNLSSLDELPTLAEIRDLDRVNEELNLGDEEIIEPRTLEIEADEQEPGDDSADADLDAVTEQVNRIQENVRSLFAAPDETAEAEEDSEDTGEEQGEKPPEDAGSSEDAEGDD